MKFIKLALAASVALAAVATPAYADTIDINIGATQVTQSVAQKTNQVAGSVAIAVGTVSDHSDLSSTAFNGVNMVSLDESVTQSGSLVNGDLLMSGVTQKLQDTTNQVALSATASAGIGNWSSSGSVAANMANNVTSTRVVVHQ